MTMEWNEGMTTTTTTMTKRFRRPSHTSSRAIHMMRKVQSLDGLRLSISSKSTKFHPDQTTVDEGGEWKQPSPPTNKMASTFSTYANRRRYSRSKLFGGETDHHHHHHLSSLTTDRLDCTSPSSPAHVSPRETETSPTTMLLDGRSGLHILIFTLLVLATLADVAYRSDVVASRAGLGSAMIGSVTQVLSPILPFAGGMDLRQTDNWKPWLPSTDIPRGGSSTVHTPAKYQRGNRAVSAPTPFVPVEDIAQMTLADVAVVFQYAMESSHIGFDRPTFVQSLSPLLLEVLEAMDQATHEARGPHVLPTLTHLVETEEQVSGDVDALKFCAAMRILAEWRVLRQVPDGYKGYAVGMNLGHKDVVQNLAKMETVVHDWIAVQELDNSVRSPTLRQLLQHEVDLKTHPKLPQLKEKSAGMGLLWVRRQLHYQTAIFANVLQVPHQYPETKLAVSAAYTEVYGQYHGWAVQKIFNYSFQAAPQAVVIYRHMNPHYLNQLLQTQQETETEESVQQTLVEEEEDIVSIVQERSDAFLHSEEERMHHVHCLEENQDMPSKESNLFLKMGSHIESEWKNLFCKVNKDWDQLGKHIGGEWDKLGKHIGGEWDKLSDRIQRILDPKPASHHHHHDLRGGAEIPLEELEHYIDTQMEQNAHDHIQTFLQVSHPLLQDLEELFVEMNMNDPTKV